MLFTNIILLLCGPFNSSKVKYKHLKTVCFCVYGSGDPENEEQTCCWDHHKKEEE